MGKFRISGVPITEGRKLVGIITNRDLKFEEDFTKKIKESMTSEGLITAKEGITLEEAKKILAKARKEKLPIVDDDFNLKGLITIKDIEKQIKYPLSAKDGQGRLLCGAALGITANCLERAQELVNAKVDVVVLDSAMDTLQTCCTPLTWLRANSRICRLLQVTWQQAQLLRRSSRPALTLSKSVSDLDPSVPHVSWPVSVCLRSQRLWTAMRWRTSTASRSLPMEDQVLRRHDKGHCRRRQCMYDGKHLCRM